MNVRRTSFSVTFLVALSTLCGAVRGGEDVFNVLRMVPSDLPIVVVVRDLENLEKSVQAFGRQLGSDDATDFGLSDLREELAIAEWADFSKPFAMGTHSLSDKLDAIFWVCVPEFTTKVKTRPGAKEVEGVWHLTVEEGEQKTEGGEAQGAVEPKEHAGKKLFVKVKGDYVVAATTLALLEKGCKADKPLAAEMKARGEIIGQRDVVIHLNMDELHDRAVAGLGNAAQMAPMVAMMLAQQGGGADPMMITSMLSAVFKAAESLVEQLAYVEVAIDVSEKAIDATVMSGYRDGPIKSYLAKQRPASRAFFKEIPEQSYLAAFGFQLPGEESPVLDYVEKLVVAAIPPPPVGEGGAQGSGTADAIKLVIDLYRQIEGVDAVFAMRSDGFKESGELLTKNPKRVVELTKQMLSSENPLIKAFSGGMSMESVGAKKIGGTDVEVFAMKLDPANPATPQLSGMMGKDTRYGIGIVKDRVYFCLGNDEDIDRVFSGKRETSLAASPYVKEALAALPAKYNAVGLIDLAAAASSSAVMMGMPVTPLPPGPPVAITVSLSGEPARLDVHVPAIAILRVKQVMAPPKPM